MRHTSRSLLLILGLLMFTCALWAGTTGKIAGTVTDAETGEPLAGANVLISGTALGAAADINGQYTILHVPPGIYDVAVSVIGYSKTTIKEVRVRIDQTARVNFSMQMEALEGETVTIVAERTGIKEDVATSVVAVSAQEVEELPVSNVNNVVGLQAGVRGNMQIRGGDADASLFMLDGFTMRDPRNNQPVTSVALSAVKEISIERGGFNAEYGQVQSGLVNVITKEGSKQNYHGSITTKYSPPAAKHFDISVHHPESMWMKPYFDDDVCWTGTSNGAWDEFTRAQYNDFEGWNEISRKLNEDNDPTNDLTPLGAQRVYMYEVRKQAPNDEPDYEIDAGFGGPVPGISEKLGNLRFFTSYRKQRQMLLFPLTRDDYVNYDWNIQVTSDISSSMKLRINGLMGKQFTHEHNWSPGYYLIYPNNIAGVIAERAQRLFSSGHYSLADIGHKSVGAKLTHTLNPKTFYEVSLEHFVRDYNTRPGPDRNTDPVNEIVPGFFMDEFPLGYDPEGENGLVVGGSAHASKARDFTVASATTFKADLTSQINFNNLIKTGVEFAYNNLDFDYGVIQSLTGGKEYASRVQMVNKPIRAAVYLQDKLETKGFTMNAGLRLDYSNSNTDWWNVNPYDKSFFSSKFNEDNEYEMKNSKGQFQISPRLGISHPITENSKLFFNYGHFKQMPQYETLFRIARDSQNQLADFGDPNLTLAKTVSYELGYDHVLLNDYLVQINAFYRDISDQQNATTYTSIDGVVYELTTSTQYEDIRGFELTMRKTMGQWWSGFANYTYQVSSQGHFGPQSMYQDPALQKEYNEATVNLYQQRPIPRPYARVNLSCYSPDDFGPALLGHNILGGFMANLLLDWQAGNWITWNPKLVSGLTNNVEGVDYFNAVLRFSKTVGLGKFRLQFLVDASNLFNTKRMSMVAWGKGGDRNGYMNSLHLPESDGYDNIPGDDKYGDYREYDVTYQPMKLWGSAIDVDNDQGENGVIYYEGPTGDYYQYADDAWTPVEQARIDKLLKDKAYIDMPNNRSFAFLNPRQIYFGLRLSFDLK